MQIEMEILKKVPRSFYEALLNLFLSLTGLLKQDGFLTRYQIDPGVRLATSSIFISTQITVRIVKLSLRITLYTKYKCFPFM